MKSNSNGNYILFIHCSNNKSLSAWPCVLDNMVICIKSGNLDRGGRSIFSSNGWGPSSWFEYFWNWRSPVSRVFMAPKTKTYLRMQNMLKSQQPKSSSGFRNLKLPVDTNPPTLDGLKTGKKTQPGLMNLDFRVQARWGLIVVVASQWTRSRVEPSRATGTRRGQVLAWGLLPVGGNEHSLNGNYRKLLVSRQVLPAEDSKNFMDVFNGQLTLKDLFWNMIPTELLQLRQTQHGYWVKFWQIYSVLDCSVVELLLYWGTLSCSITQLLLSFSWWTTTMTLSDIFLNFSWQPPSKVSVRAHKNTTGENPRIYLG